MAFKSKTDPFGIASETCIVASTADGASAQVAEARDENGTIVAQEVYGETVAPSADYAIKSATTFDNIVLGNVVAYGGKRVVLTSLTINTSAGGEPTISASGEGVGATGSGECPARYAVPSFQLGPCHHAKILFSAFQIGSTGCYLQSANYTARVEVGTATVDGEIIAHGVYSGVLECQVEIVSTAGNTPTLTAGDGWVVTSPLSETNPNGDYATYSATLRELLPKSDAPSGS